MDYFNELLDSYSRLKKRTFKLRYIQEETAEELNKRADLKHNPGKIGKYQGYYHTYDRKTGDPTMTQVYVSSDPPGTPSENKNYFLLPETDKEEISREKRAEPGEELYEEVPEEYRQNIRSINGISQSLIKMCDEITATFQKTKKFVSCEEKIRDYLSFQNKTGDSLGKLFSKGGTTKGIKITRDKDGKFELDVSEGMDTVESDTRPKVLDNLNDVLKEITSEEETDCKKLEGKVAKTKVTSPSGKSKLDRFIIYGVDNTTGVVLPGTGKFSEIIFNKVKTSCPNIEKLYDDAVTKSEINAKSGTLAERLFAFGNDLYRIAIEPDPEKAKVLLKDIAEALLESEKVTQALVDSFDTDMITLEEESGYRTLLEDNELFKNKKELGNLMVLFVKANKDLYEKMGADKIVPYGAKSKQGARADNMLVFKNEEDAKKAARSVGFSEEEGQAYLKTEMKEFLKNLPTNKQDKVKKQLESLGIKESDSFYALGLGQKLYENFKDAKLGEYNRIERMMMAFLGTIPESDTYYSDDFNEKASEYPVSEAGQAMAQKILEDHQFIEDVLAGGEEFLNQKGNQKLTPDRYKFAQDILKQSANPQGKLANLDPTNEADQQYIKEYIQRSTLMKNLKDSYETSPSDAYDSVLRMAFLTGGNSQDLLQLVISKSDNSTRLFSQNAVFEELRNNKDKYSLEFTESSVKFVDTESGKNVGSLSFSRTGSKSSKKPNTRTRGEFKISNDAQTNIAKAEERSIPSMENSSKLSELLTSQIELLNEILNQTKNS
jgi:hypothetical protein